MDTKSRRQEIDTSTFKPGYVLLHERGVLAQRAQTLMECLNSCTLCPRRCGVNRNAGQAGFCGIGAEPRVAAVSIHPWEEPPISGTRGSGTIFFSGCTLKCVFCQNYPISQLGIGRSITVEELAGNMLELQKKGAHNINLVTSTHQMAAVVQALRLAVPHGLNIPLVYNTSGYESLETLRLLEGMVDVYLPDIKYADPEVAGSLSGAADYIQANREALMEMWRQVGPLQMDGEGIARKGMLVRHLVLPDDLAGSEESFAFLAEKVGPKVWVSLMDQYFPAHKATLFPPLHRKITQDEYDRAFRILTNMGMQNGFVQEHPECETDLS